MLYEVITTLTRSSSIAATPTEVLITIGQIQHKVTVIIEFKKDLATTGSGVTYSALTTIVTSGSHASGDTGLNSCTSGFNAAWRVPLRPIRMPTGMASSDASTKPDITVTRLRNNFV